MKKPKVLFFDIETSSALGYFWPNKLYDQNIIKVKKQADLLCYSYKWRGSKGITGTSMHLEGSEKKLIKTLHPVFNEMDYLVGHNVDKFDRKQSNSRFGKYGLSKPAPYKIIDTMRVMKQHFHLPSYTLSACAEFFGIEQKKKKIGWEVWEACMEGDAKAFSKLLSYNKQDIRVLEALYNKLVEGGWIEDPMQEVLKERPEECRACGSDRLLSKGYVRNKSATARRFICLSCGKQCQVKV